MKLFELFSIEEGPHDPHIFKVLFMAGGPGSGKSFYAKKLSKGTGLQYIDLDDYFNHLIKTQDLSFRELRDKAKHLRQAKMDSSISGNLGMLIDGTGRRYDRIADIDKDLKAKGYETAMVFVNTDLEVALKRNLDRDRVVPPEWLTNTHKEVRSNIGKFQMLFGSNLFIIDNSKDDSEGQFDIVWKKVHQFLNTPIKGQ